MNVDTGLQTSLPGEHRNAIGFFTARASGRPDVDWPATPLVSVELEFFENFIDQRAKLTVLSKEVGLVGRQLINEIGKLVGSATAIAPKVKPLG